MDPEDRSRPAAYRSEDLLRMVTDNAPIVVFAIDRDGIFTLSDGKGLATLGLKPGQVVGMSVFDVYRDVPDVLENIRRAFAGEECKGLNHVGNVVFDVTYSPIFDPHGAVDGIAGIGVDVTEQAHAADRLRETRDTMYGVFDSVPQAIFWKDRDSVFLGCNRVFARSMKLDDPSQVIGRTDYDVVASRETAESFRADDREVMNTGLAKRHIIRTGLQSDGTRFWSDTTKIPLVDQGGRVTGVLGVYEDITARRSAEEAVLQEKQFSETLLESLPGIFFIYDQNLNLVRWNLNHEILTGFTAEELKTRKALDWFSTDEEKARVIEAAQKVQTEGVVRLEARLTYKDGRQVPHLFTSVRLDTPKGPMMMGMAFDISDRVRAQEQRLDMERRLLHAQKLESLGVLAGGIAHDFNNLLMAVLGNLDLAIQQISPASPALPSLEQAIQATRRATDLTRQMLAYSGKGKFVVHRLDLGDVLRENSDLFRASISRTVTLDLAVPRERAIIEGDPGQVQQIVMNLITNASDAIGDRPGTIRLESGVTDCSAEDLQCSRLEERPPGGRFAYIQVSDNGQGMDEATQQRLFDPFFTTKFTGRGLGMSAVLGIVRGHKGAIFVDSAPGAGTSIRVMFPTSAVSTEPASATGIVAPPHAATALRRRTVLVVDDEDAVRRLCMTFVERLGHRGLEAADGEDALELFKQRPGEIDCVLLDLTMPRLDGLSTFRAMRAIRPDVRVILSSGYSEQDATRQFDGEGLTGFIQKPFRLQDFKAILAGSMAGID